MYIARTPKSNILVYQVLGVIPLFTPIYILYTFWKILALRKVDFKWEFDAPHS